MAIDEIKKYYNKEINNYMARFDDLNDVDTQILENGLKELLGINIGVDFEYSAESTLNETTGDKIRKVFLKNIHIYYTYDDYNTSTPKIGKISYIVD